MIGSCDLRHAAWLDGWLRARGIFAPWHYPRVFDHREVEAWRCGYREGALTRTVAV